MSPPRRKQQKPLPDFRKAALTPEDETGETKEHFVAVLRRNAERGLLQRILSKLEPPAEIDGRRLSEADRKAYALAVNHARGTTRAPDAFLKVADAQTKKASVRFFLVCAAAMAAVKDERAGRYSQTDAHRMAALQAKLEIEKNSGSLPTHRQVKEHAFNIVWKFIRHRRQDFEPYEPENKRWSKILASVGLSYLPAAVRGKGRE